MRIITAANTAPTFTDGATAERSVAENTPAGENIGAALTATATDTGDTLTYSLGGTDAASFDIDTTDGQLSVGATTELDYEATKNTYAVTVSVSDGTESASIDVTITVTDAAGTVSLSMNAPVVDTSVTATLTDSDDVTGTTTWQWASSATSDGTFTDISGATTDTYKPVSGDVGNFLRATASYTDGDGSSKTASAVTDSAVFDPSTYDQNGDGAVDIDELLKAAQDYFKDMLTLDQLLSVARLYFKS